MSLKCTSGKAGQIKYLGRQVTVWKYKDCYALKAEFDNLGRCLDRDSMAWVGNEFLVYEEKIVGKTTQDGKITWVSNPTDLPAQFKVEKKAKTLVTPQTSRGVCRELPIVETAADIEVGALWKMATRTDWEAIMVKTSW